MKQKGAFSIPIGIDLYRDGNPVWIEYKRELGIDLAAIQIEVPSGAAGIVVQDFAEQDDKAIEPGIDVIITGYPIAHSKDDPFPIWKRAMIASEPGFFARGAPQILIDTPGTPGMSGSPVYRSAPGFLISQAMAEAFDANERGNMSNWELIKKMTVDQLNDETVALTFVGVYAGSTGNEVLNKLSLGRMFLSSYVDKLIKDGEPGVNPFPPD